MLTIMTDGRVKGGTHPLRALAQLPEQRATCTQAIDIVGVIFSFIW